MSHNFSKSFQQEEAQDPRLSEILSLYKQPAMIRDMKQVFFYTEASSTLTNVNPLTILTGLEVPLSVDQFSTPSYYYAPIGTTRRLDIIQKIL